MSLEQKIEALTAAVEALTAKMEGGAASSTTTTKTEKTTRSKTGSSEKPKRSQEEMVAALTKLKDEHGANHAKEIIKKVGGADRMADIPDAKYDAVFKAAEAKYAELSEGGDEGDDDGI